MPNLLSELHEVHGGIYDKYTEDRQKCKRDEPSGM